MDDTKNPKIGMTTADVAKRTHYGSSTIRKYATLLGIAYTEEKHKVYIWQEEDIERLKTVAASPRKKRAKEEEN
ncbi:MAG: hypothetical protein LBO67_00215 [Spirochaetaceae bacterium]|nr:hypothetical protein [Spirochaetaceae bacterium]